MTDKTPELPDPNHKSRATLEPAAEGGSASVAKMLESFALLTLHSLAECRGQSIRSLLQDMTGLSKGRIAKGKLDNLRPSTRKKIAAHQQKWLEDTFKDKPEHLASVQAHIAASPTLSNGKGAILATWVHQFERSPEFVLPISKAVALIVDEIFDALLGACADDDLERWKQMLLDHLRQRGIAISVGDQRVVLAATAAELEACEAICTWSQAAALTSRLLEHWYLNIITALDAEWSSHYFAGRQTMPLFPLVMGRLPDGLGTQGKAASRKKSMVRPSQQLLQFLYALVFFYRYKKWPAQAPRPSTLAGILYRSDQKELANNALLYNYFDGTTELTFDRVYDHWVQLTQHFMGEKKPENLPVPPYPMISLALQWQRLFVLNEGKTLFALDMRKYEALWRHHRQRWDEHQAARNLANWHAGHRSNEPIVWPAWALNQLSLPS